MELFLLVTLYFNYIVSSKSLSVNKHFGKRSENEVCFLLSQTMQEDLKKNLIPEGKVKFFLFLLTFKGRN